MGVHLEIRGILPDGKQIIVHRILIPHCINKQLYERGCSASDLDLLTDGEVTQIVQEVGRNMKKAGDMVKPPGSAECCLCFGQHTPSPQHVRYQVYKSLMRLHQLATKYKSTRWYLRA